MRAAHFTSRVVAVLLAWVFLAGNLSAEGPSTSRPASGASSNAKEMWSPPRFQERLEERLEMVEVIRAYGMKDPAVLRAVSRVPRHEFVPPNLRKRAYHDTPLPIGHGQTISQPYIVAEMTRLLHLNRESRVLEVGTGSGYQAAVLTEMTPFVSTVEILHPLARAAEKRLKRLGYTVVDVRHADGYFGWPEKAPFDGIVVTAAAGEIPPPLVSQLRPGGRMVIPVGPVFGTQALMLVQKDMSGRVHTKSLMAVRFVPLTRADKDTP
jgi:protein-L-isoaspartate(D-aspartate) O-methyltransferase